MTLQQNSEYQDNDGNSVTIIGLARREPVEGKTIYWSLQGDHYSEDGRFVMCRRVAKEPYRLESYLLDHDNRRSLDLSVEPKPWR